MGWHLTESLQPSLSLLPVFALANDPQTVLYNAFAARVLWILEMILGINL